MMRTPVLHAVMNSSNTNVLLLDSLKCLAKNDGTLYEMKSIAPTQPKNYIVILQPLRSR